MGGGQTVFLSHTSEFEQYPPGRSYVAAAKDACAREGFRYVDMSLWAPAARSAAATCRQRVRECDVYVGIIGFAYGSSVPDDPEHRSYVELEFDEAAAAGMPCLLFLLADDGDMPLGLGRGNPSLGGYQESFRRRLEQSGDRFTVGWIRNPDQLRDVVGQALRELSPVAHASGTSQRVTHQLPSTDLDERRPRVPFMARPLEEGLVRRLELDQIVGQVRAAAAQAADPDGVGPQVVAIQGTGGSGKTTVATWACHELREEFPDGVLWATLGDQLTEHQIIDRFRKLLLALGDDGGSFPTASDAGAHLGDVLENRRALLVLDDVWRREDLELFLRGGPATVRLVTTRDKAALRPRTKPVCVDQLSESQTRQLLARGLHDRGVDWSELIRRTGQRPLLADLVNTTLQDEVENGRPLGEAVAELAGGLARQRRPAVTATVEESMTRLQRRIGEVAVSRYRDLAVFPEGVAVPVGVLGAWWNIEAEDVQWWAEAVTRLSLVKLEDSSGRGGVRLHGVLREYLRSTRSDAEWRERERSLLAAHRPATGRWADLPEDADHLWRYLAVHLHEAGLEDELLETLADAGFLARAVYRLGTWAVLDQFAVSDSAAAARLRTWLRRWANLVDGLPAVADVATTLMARPEAPDVLIDALGDVSGLSLRYAHGWPCPEPAGSALDTVVGRHHRRVQSVAWSPDGDRVASGDGNGVLRIASVDRDAPPVVMASGHWVRAVAWSPDGARIAFGSDDGAVAVWQPRAPREQPVVRGEHPVGVRTVAWSPDGSWIASASDDGVRLWSGDGSGDPLQPRHEPFHEPSPDEWVRSLAWSPKGERLAYGDDAGDLWVWPVEDGAPGLLIHHQSAVLAVAWSRDGTVASGAEDGTLLLQRPDSDGAMLTLPTPGSAVLALSWSPDGHRLASGCADGSLWVWSGEGGKPEAELGGHDGGVLALAWSGNGDRLLSGGSDGALRLWHVDGAAGGLQLRQDADRVRGIAWSPDSSRLATSNGDGGVRVWPGDREAGPTLVGRHHGEARSVTWSADGGILASGGDDRAVMLWAPDACEEPREELAAPGQCVRGLAWSSSGSHLACAGGDGSVQVWRLGPGPIAIPLPRQGEWVRAVAWSPKSPLLAIGGDDGAVRLWDLRGEEAPTELGRHECGVGAITWLAAGRHVLSGDDHGGLRLWDIERGGYVDVGQHELGVRGVAGSPDGSLVASVGGDSALRLWHLTSGAADRQPICTLALTGTLHAVAWQPSGARLAVAGVNGLYVLELIGAPGPEGGSRPGTAILPARSAGRRRGAARGTS